MFQRVIAGISMLIACSAALGAQAPPANRPLSPPGSTQAQVLGRWTKGDRPTFAVGQERYVGGRR